MLLMDNITKSLEKGEFVVGVFLHFLKILTVLVMIFYYWNQNIMVFEALHWNSLRVIQIKGFRMSHMMEKINLKDI